jgi:DNA repair exonuclease SbcCD nuclease subunit
MAPPSPGPSSRRIRLLHTSDVHVDDRPGSLEPLKAVVAVGAAHHVDLALVAGDLFDHPRVTESTVGAAFEQLVALGVPCVVIPGNHDPFGGPESKVRRDLFTSAPDHVWLADGEEGTTLDFPDLDLEVWARGIRYHTPEHRPLEGYASTGLRRWRVALTHGHVVGPADSFTRSSPIADGEIAALACDYVALGHWHQFTDVSDGEVAAYYCGSPMPGESDVPSVNIVDLDPEAGVLVMRTALAP